MTDSSPPTPDRPTAAPAQDARERGDTAASTATSPSDDRADVWATRLRPYVIAAAVASIPALFISLGDGPAADAAEIVNLVTLGVLTSESLLLFGLAEDRRQWLRRNRWPLIVVAVSIPLVLLAVGAGQFLRLLSYGRAFRVARVSRVLKLEKVLRAKTSLAGASLILTRGGVAVVAVAFAAIVLSDPDSESRRVLEDVAEVVGWPGLIGGVAVIALVGGTAWKRWRGRRDTAAADDDGDAAAQGGERAA